MHVNNNLICILLQPHACMHACIDYSRVRARQWHVSFPFRYNSHGRRFSQCTLIHIFKRQAGRHHTRVLDRNHPDFLAACMLVLLGRLLRSLVIMQSTVYGDISFSPGLVQEQSDTLEPCSREDACSSTLRFASVKLLFALALSLIAVACLALIVASCWSIGSFLRSSMLFERKTRWRAAQCCLSSSTLAWPASVHDEIDCVK
jgi:hypothetical protein